MNASNPLLWAFAIFAWFAASVAWRRAFGKPLFARPRADAVFVERWASGRAGRGLVARLSTTRNCLQVQVTGQELIVTPHFPVTVGFMPEIYGLDHRIPLSAVRSALIVGGRRIQAVEVQYDRPDDDPGVLQLLLRQGEAFIAALQAGRPRDRGAEAARPSP